MIATNYVLQGDCREMLRTLPESIADTCITDPPYGDTSLKWDVQCSGWISEVARVLKPIASVWVFGSMRFLAPLFAEFESLGFRYSQDIVWEKHNGSGLSNDRFRRVHEHADEIVQRKCRRVLLPNLDWKWQIVNYDKLFEWGHTVEQDKEVLDAYGSELDVQIVRVL